MSAVVSRLVAAYAWLVLATGAALGALGLLVQALASPAAAKPRFAALTRLLNAGTGGSPDHSTSARVGAYGPRWAELLINALAFDRHHCRKAAVDEGLVDVATHLITGVSWPRR
jgi:hypothetical protein